MLHARIVLAHLAVLMKVLVRNVDAELQRSLIGIFLIQCKLSVSNFHFASHIAQFSAYFPI